MRTLGIRGPRAPELRLTGVAAVGGRGRLVVTVNPFVNVPVWLSGLVTATLRVPTVAVELMVMLAVSCVAELNVHELTVMPAPKLQVAPLWKLLPVMMTLGKLCP